MGGEKPIFRGAPFAARGSPPHGRGKDHPDLWEEMMKRITPAWAGKSNAGARTWETGQDHPRMGGEKFGSMTKEIAPVGSPPHGRGKGLTGNARIAGRRITPAWAGKSVQNHVIMWSCWDHPRMGGEKIHLLSCRLFRTGSPPHGRGKDVQHHGKGRENGITPAWAGKSQIESSGATSNEDHPRMGGEKLSLRL